MLESLIAALYYTEPVVLLLIFTAFSAYETQRVHADRLLPTIRQFSGSRLLIVGLLTAYICSHATHLVLLVLGCLADQTEWIANDYRIIYHLSSILVFGIQTKQLLKIDQFNLWPFRATWLTAMFFEVLVEFLIGLRVLITRQSDGINSSLTGIRSILLISANLWAGHHWQRVHDRAVEERHALLGYSSSSISFQGQGDIHQYNGTYGSTQASPDSGLNDEELARECNNTRPQDAMEGSIEVCEETLAEIVRELKVRFQSLH